MERFCPNGFRDRSGRHIYPREGDAENPIAALTFDFRKRDFIARNIYSMSWREFAIARHRVLIKPSGRRIDPRDDIKITFVHDLSSRCDEYRELGRGLIKTQP